MASGEYFLGDRYSKRVTFTVLSLLLVVVLIFNVFRNFSNGGTLSLLSLLEFFSNVPSLDMSLASFELIPVITNWGTFQFLADFINIIITIANVGVYASKGLINVIIFVAYIVRFLFVG